jgi:hypothetical protein
MHERIVPKSPLPWWAAGLMLGMVQILAIGLKKPLGVSTQFVVVEGIGLHKLSSDYSQNHGVLKNAKYQHLGYGWWLDVGLVAGAFLAALLAGRWRLRKTTIWWQASRGPSIQGRMIAGFVGGFLILLGARIAHGCTSGQFASGWAQLSLSVVPFTVTLFGFGMLTALLVYRKSPDIEK